jgi:hypothetical protein
VGGGGVHQYINCCGAGRKKLVYKESTFPSGKIFPSQKGQPLNFLKPLIIYFFLLSHDERKLEGGRKGKQFLALRSSFQAVAYFGKCPTHGGIISPTSPFHHPLGLAGWLYFVYRLFPSGYNCSYKLSLTCMNECMKEKGTLTYMPLQMTALKECACICVLLLQFSELSEPFCPSFTLSLSLSLSSLSLPTKPN